MRTVATWVGWWLVLTLLWLLYQGEWNAIEIYAALSAGAFSIVVAAIIRRHARPTARVEVRLLQLFAGVPWRVVRDFVVVTRLLAGALTRRRVPSGEFRAVPYAVGGERPPDRGRRALLSMVVGYAPNSYVIDIDAGRRLVLLHLLSPVPRGEELP